MMHYLAPTGSNILSFLFGVGVGIIFSALFLSVVADRLNKEAK